MSQFLAYQLNKINNKGCDLVTHIILHKKMKTYIVKVKVMTNPPWTKIKIVKVNDLEELNQIKGLQDFEILETIKNKTKWN
jgi:hypothetical protein